MLKKKKEKEIQTSCPRNSRVGPVITVRARSTTGGYVFTGVCLLTGGGGIPSPFHNTSLSEGTPMTGPRSLAGGGGVPYDRVHPSQVRSCLGGGGTL